MRSDFLILQNLYQHYFFFLTKMREEVLEQWRIVFYFSHQTFVISYAYYLYKMVYQPLQIKKQRYCENDQQKQAKHSQMNTSTIIIKLNMMITNDIRSQEVMKNTKKEQMIKWSNYQALINKDELIDLNRNRSYVKNNQDHIVPFQPSKISNLQNSQRPQYINHKQFEQQDNIDDMIQITEQDMEDKGQGTYNQLFNQQISQYPDIYDIEQIINTVYKKSPQNCTLSMMFHAVDQYCPEIQQKKVSQEQIEPDVESIDSTPPYQPSKNQDYRKRLSKSDLNNYAKALKSQKMYEQINDPNVQTTSRQNLQRKIAYIFIRQGYGIAITRRVLDYQLPNNVYNTLMTAVIRTSLRKLIDIITYTFNMNIYKYDSRQQLYLRSFLVNSRKWMKPSQLRTFLAIVTKVFDLSRQEIIIHPSDLINLYNVIARNYKNKNQSIPLIPVDSQAVRPISFQVPRYIQNKANNQIITHETKENKNITHSQKIYDEQEQQNHKISQPLSSYTYHYDINTQQLKQNLLKLINVCTQLRRHKKKFPKLLLNEYNINIIINKNDNIFKKNLQKALNVLQYKNVDNISKAVLFVNQFMMKNQEKNDLQAMFI